MTRLQTMFDDARVPAPDQDLFEQGTSPQSCHASEPPECRVFGHLRTRTACRLGYGRSRSSSRRLEATIVNHSFISVLDWPVAEGRCGYAGSNKAFSVERDSVGCAQARSRPEAA